MCSERHMPRGEELARLPKGRHGLPREFVASNHRARLIAGLIEAVAEKGYAKTTISDITREAAVSRRTFYEHFDSKEECFLSACDWAMGHLTSLIQAAFEEQPRWAAGVHAAFAALLDFLAREPALARLSMVESARSIPEAFDRYRRLVDAFVAILSPGRGEPAAAGARLPPPTEESLAGGIATLLTRRVAAGHTERLPELLPEIVVFALVPYLGMDDALSAAAPTRGDA